MSEENTEWKKFGFFNGISPLFLLKLDLTDTFNHFCWGRLLMERFPGNSHAWLAVGLCSPGLCRDKSCWSLDLCLEHSPLFGSGSSSFPFASLLLAWPFQNRNKSVARKQESPDRTWADLFRIESSETCAADRTIQRESSGGSLFFFGVCRPED